MKDLVKTIDELCEASVISRSKGMLAMEKYAETLKDNFLKIALFSIMDPKSPEQIADFLCYIMFEEKRKLDLKVQFLKLARNSLLAFNLIKLVEKKQITFGVKVGTLGVMALSTAILKLQKENANELMYMKLVIQGVCDISRGINYKLIREHLEWIISPNKSTYL